MIAMILMEKIQVRNMVLKYFWTEVCSGLDVEQFQQLTKAYLFSKSKTKKKIQKSKLR